MAISLETLNGKTLLVVGAASHEGAEFCKKILLQNVNARIIGVDMIPCGEEGMDMYQTLDDINHIVNKKYVEFPALKDHKIWLFFNELLENPGVIDNLFSSFTPDIVCDFRHNNHDLLQTTCEKYGIELVVG